MATVADDLDAAADYLVEHGWQVGTLGEHGGPRCVAGAIDSVGDDVFWSVRFALLDFTGATSLASWNDAQPDAATVIQTLRDCAAKLRIDES